MVSLSSWLESKTEELSTRYRKTRRRYHKLAKSVQLLIKWSIILPLAFIGDIALLYFLSILTSAHLINWQTVISFLAVEVLAAVVARLLGIGQESQEEINYRNLLLAEARARIATRFSHLTILGSEEIDQVHYPDDEYYVLNLISRRAYWVPAYIQELVAEGVIGNYPMRNLELNEILKEFNFEVLKRFPVDDELYLARRSREKWKYPKKRPE